MLLSLLLWKVRTEISVAMIAGAATVGAAVIANWDKIKPIIHEITQPKTEEKKK